MTFAIEADIPVPTRATRSRGDSKYPFRNMDVGESFFVGGDVKPTTLRSAIGAYRKAVGEGAAKFAVRAVEGGNRVWRTE